MRLSAKEINIIKSVILRDKKMSKIILFGSRVYDEKKGGDIDLLLQTSEKITLKEKLEILAKLEYNGIERKVDLLIQTPDSEHKNIFTTAIKEGIVL